MCIMVFRCTFPIVNLCKTRGNWIFSKNGKMILLIINCKNGLGKPRKFSKFQMIKRIALLNSSRER